MADDNEPTREQASRDALLRKLTIISAVAVSALAAVSFGFLVFRVARDPAYEDLILKQHFDAVIGIPCAGFAAFAIVVFLRQTDGPIEFESLGFKFKGAAGQVVMWALCFLVMILAIKLLW